MSYLSSFVIGRDPLDSFYGSSLDRGTLDGVASTMPWSVTKGTCWAMVVEAEPTSCKVMTILHPNFTRRAWYPAPVTTASSPAAPNTPPMACAC